MRTTDHVTTSTPLTSGARCLDGLIDEKKKVVWEHVAAPPQFKKVHAAASHPSVCVCY